MSSAVAPSVLATDVGSTTTKALLLEGGRLVATGEFPTTVEAPWEDVMVGVRGAVRRIEEVSGRTLLPSRGAPSRPRAGRTPTPTPPRREPERPGEAGPAGVDLCVSTSSAGGGLQMTVAGLVGRLSAASARRAALGAGAVVLDVVAMDDGRTPSERVQRLADLRPDIVLMAGGVDGGSVQFLAALAETIAQAAPRPRFGEGYRLPVVYAGNREAADLVRAVLEPEMDVHVVANLRPRHDAEHLGPAREAIGELFMNHVIAQAPGYPELCRWVSGRVLPTPSAVARMVQGLAANQPRAVAAVDIGGATTDVFTAPAGGGECARSVSANLGMSYSLANVCAEAGFEALRRWLPFDLAAADLTDWAANKTVRPARVPESRRELLLEHAAAREALRLAWRHHRELRPDAPAPGLLVGSGGVLSHAPRLAQAALLLVDAFEPAGVTHLALDRGFLSPHLGALAEHHPALAAEVFERDCLVWLGTCLAPQGRRPSLRLRLGGLDVAAGPGELAVAPLPAGQRVRAEVQGMGAVELRGGAVGVILDCRGRPVEPTRARLDGWLRALAAYAA